MVMISNIGALMWRREKKMTYFASSQRRATKIKQFPYDERRHCCITYWFFSANTYKDWRKKMRPNKLIGSKQFYAAITSKRDHKTFGPKNWPFPELKKADHKIILPQIFKEGLSLLPRLILVAPDDKKNQVIDTNMEKIKKTGEADGYTCWRWQEWF